MFVHMYDDAVFNPAIQTGPLGTVFKYCIEFLEKPLNNSLPDSGDTNRPVSDLA